MPLTNAWIRRRNEGNPLDPPPAEVAPPAATAPEVVETVPAEPVVTKSDVEVGAAEAIEEMFAEPEVTEPTAIEEAIADPAVVEEEDTSEPIPPPILRDDSDAEDLINLNAEDLTVPDLTPLPSVGRVTAQRILDARQDGLFVDFEDFATRVNLKLGEAELEALRDKVRFE